MTVFDQPLLIKRLLPRNPAHPPGYVIIWPVSVQLPSGRTATVCAYLHLLTAGGVVALTCGGHLDH